MKSFDSKSSFPAWILTFLCLLIPLSVSAQMQGISNLGTDFWFGFMPNYVLPADYLHIYLASPSTNHVEVEVYGGGSGSPLQTYTYNLVPNQTQWTCFDFTYSGFARSVV